MAVSEGVIRVSQINNRSISFVMTISFIHKSQSSLGQTARMKKKLLRYLLKCLKTISRGFIGNLTQHTAGSARVHLMIW